MNFSALVAAIVADRIVTSRHSLIDYDRIKQVAKLITVYRPDPGRWVNWRLRR